MGEAGQYLIASLSFSDIWTVLILGEGVCIMNWKRLQAVWERQASGSLSGSLRTRKAFPRVGGVEKNTAHVVTLLGSVLCTRPCFQNLWAHVFDQFWDFFSHCLFSRIHLPYFLLLGLKIDIQLLIPSSISVNLPFILSVSLHQHTSFSVTFPYLLSP